ncbi:type II secretion system F family protein [Oligosphaera ethanolica]|uniref:Type II secretory pathway component PulF n=1 Tax=Oligosphaera ethanolica TaxID=760260 RepID=A0AAE3VE91_9BACT|nr:type II secretion system F family protein [Oligosphaera ethanolica]MDQ0288705.1 type II secretory pathway component PulF [Oligosphaera ethanolica]
MALYKYKVSDAAGKISELLIEGDSQADAARRIQRRGLMPLDFLGEGSKTQQGGGWFGPKLNVVEFTERLVPLLQANITLERALGIVGDDNDNPVLAETVGDLRRGLHEGKKFSQLIRDRGRTFPQLYSGVVEAGEEAGALPQVMGELRRFLSESQELRSFIISSSVYPLFIAFTGVVMMVVVLGVIVPRFATALAGAGVESMATTILLGVSSFFRNYWWLSLVLLALVIYVVTQLRKEGSALRIRYDHWILRVPLAGRLVLYANIARLCRTMAILMRSGVHLLNTVVIANRVVQNQAISQSIVGLSGELRQGQRLSAALSKSEYIPSLMLKMIAVGEETGSVETMLERVADRYEEDMKRLVKRLLSLFEPAIIICLGLGVGVVVLLMFMAMMDMQGAAG